MKIDIYKRLLLILLPLTLLFAGCCRIFHSLDAVPYRVVTEVRVTYKNGTLENHRQFFQCCCKTFAIYGESPCLCNKRYAHTRKRIFEQ